MVLPEGNRDIATGTDSISPMTLTIDALLILTVLRRILYVRLEKLAKTVKDYKHYYLALSREIAVLLMLRRDTLSPFLLVISGAAEKSG